MHSQSEILVTPVEHSVKMGRALDDNDYNVYDDTSISSTLTSTKLLHGELLSLLEVRTLLM